MSGFQSGDPRSGLSHAKAFGSILRGYGPPVPDVGDIGDVYIDVLTYQLFERRSTEATDPWGHYVFIVPTLYQTSLKFFGTAPPTNDLGMPGDYYMQWGGYPNYGINPLLFGPKQSFGWPENATGPVTSIAVTNGTVVLPIGLTAEGATLNDQQPAQLLQTGLTMEVIFPVPVTAATGDPVYQEGLQSSGVTTIITINTLYTATDTHSL